MTSPDPVSLAAFCYARLDEDEAAAKGAAFSTDGEAWIPAAPGELDQRYVDFRSHITRHDPARVLREVEAKRALITFAFSNAKTIDGEWGGGHNAAEIAAGECSSHGAKAAAGVLSILAAIWSGHPDYVQVTAGPTGEPSPGTGSPARS